MDVKDQIRIAAENSLVKFIELVAPHRVLGSIHRELCEWWERPERKSHQLVLLPRDHAKSALIAYRAAWIIVRRPDVRILYLSSTSNLAEKQLKMIKDILTSDVVRRYWSNLVNPEEGKREKWTNSEISVDHPKRKEEGVRDPTVFAAGLTTSVTGMHCDIAICDDIVVNENAYSEEGRKRVKEQYSLLSSIEGADAEEWVVGTRYHPKDLYNDMCNMHMDVYDSNGEVVDVQELFEKFERQVEDRGDGTGQFLWARQQRKDGKWFGFDANILAKKRAQYLDKTQFRAQYYNDPNDLESSPIKYDNFVYYEKEKLTSIGGNWYYKGKILNIIAGIDFAYSVSRTSDYTAVCVVGVDCERNYYILDIDRFKTDKIDDYYKSILGLHRRWNFKRLVAEATAAQEAIVNQLKVHYIQKEMLNINIIKVKPTSNSGTKVDRIRAVLQPLYETNKILHYRGGNCQILEEELINQNPAHDDVKDIVSAVIPHLNIPSNFYNSDSEVERQLLNKYHPRFGGAR